jgi:hypothetical protein
VLGNLAQLYYAAGSAFSAGRGTSSSAASSARRRTWRANPVRFTPNADLPTGAIAIACADNLANPKIADRSVPTISIEIAGLNTTIPTKPAGLAHKGALDNFPRRYNFGQLNLMLQRTIEESLR